jgi:hypothetical protein
MPRIARSRLKHLERLANVDGPPVGRLLYLLPDLWPDFDCTIEQRPVKINV